MQMRCEMRRSAWRVPCIQVGGPDNDSGVKTFAAALKKNKIIEQVNLEWNQIWEDGRKALAAGNASSPHPPRVVMVAAFTRRRCLRASHHQRCLTVHTTCAPRYSFESTCYVSSEQTTRVCVCLFVLTDPVWRHCCIKRGTSTATTGFRIADTASLTL